ncbi:hypothetical protein O6H91_18G054100 [Diphasiastrum complanatum]|uniref:Uncharacterized protein n=10 Tax=Diphasiastrum complanatum TaxID=34168 RepID=A0ACC2B193_DIPCM|nr:hypothetical protein O6H91_18G054100 [Diphasiastrum complanatum]KAJ7523553.1 hypothetical protein O6H91_18G054100 [Diphasiastrum complanatum]KAJ7523554.1 hypothetical protein O6H91_18G054100 [Diphasiastrum complanatum]KAJ7523555.1 hypothetical protein O6H91_18G054100 [Diphasiastrum complanatum]KAJ7523556.1 hypothetical protein O6H91_18G054100 [Diphasiastrum complanatum]
MENCEEQSRLLEEEKLYKGEKEPEQKEPQEAEVVTGLPVASSVVGAPAPRTPWASSLFACLGSNDEFCSSDLEVCVLGSLVPCMLYGSNVERLNPMPGTFANHCLGYSSLYFLGNFFFNSNFLAPCFSFPMRSAIRRRFNLQGNGEAFARSVGCSGMVESEESRERCDSACDFAVHFCCHPCSLCQEGREVRRRFPHPGFTRPFQSMLPPSEQVMAP